MKTRSLTLPLVLATVMGSGPVHAQGAPPDPVLAELGARAALPLHGIAYGAQHACGLGPDGSAWCWGRNDWGQLGTGTADAALNAPARVTGGLRFVEVGAGSGHSCGIVATGEVWCWGLNVDGQIGRPVSEWCDGHPCTTRPLRAAPGRTFDLVTVGYSHTCALADGYAYCWGRNDRGALGREVRTACRGMPCSLQPVELAGAHRFRVIRAGGEHTCGIAHGAVYCWGDNAFGQLGAADSVAWSAEPRRFPSDAPAVEIRVMRMATCAVTAAGGAACRGAAPPSVLAAAPDSLR